MQTKRKANAKTKRSAGKTQNLVRLPVQRVGESRNPPNSGVASSMSNSSGNIVSRGKNPSMEYLATLLDPERFIARVPDAECRKTAVIRSIRNVSIPLSVDAYNGGKFSFALQPILGNIGSPETYQLALVNTARIATNGQTWDNVDWSDSANYVTTILGSDLRTDINAGTLTTPPPAFQDTQFTVGGSADLAAGILVSGVGGVNSVDSTATGVKFYSPAYVGPYLGLGGGVIQLPFGDWSISLAAKVQCQTTLPAGNQICLGFQTVGPLDAVRIGIQQEATPVTATGTATILTAATFQVASEPGKNLVSFCVSAPQNGTANSTPSPAVSNVLATYLTLSPANFTSSSNYLDNGVIDEIRPVAMSVLASYVGSSFNNGGEIAIAYIPYKDLTNNYFQNNKSGRGQLQFLNNLAQLDGAYDGPISDGAWCNWAPYDPSDYKFVTPTDSNTQGYPGIICSGVFTPDNGAATTGAAIRLRICTVFEFITTSTLFETIPVVGNTMMIDNALMILKRQPFGRKNKDHQNFIQKMLAFYRANSGWINPLATSMASLAL